MGALTRFLLGMGVTVSARYIFLAIAIRGGHFLQPRRAVDA